VISRYPALLFLLLLVGSLEARDRGIPCVVALGTGSLFFWAALLLYASKEEKTLSHRTFLLFIVLFLGAWGMLFRFESLPKLESFPPSFSGKGRVILERPWGGRRAHVIATGEEKFLYRTFAREGMKEGTELFFEGSLVPLEDSSGSLKKAPSSFDGEKYWGARGVFREIQVETYRLLPEKSWNLAVWRSKLKEKLLLEFPPSLRAYLLAMWIGERDPELGEKHQRWGTAHLLAVSGFHVGLVVMLLFWLFPSFFGRIRFLAISGGMWFYIFLAGASPSALRAGMMAQILLLGRFLGYRGNGVNAVALAASFLLLWRPWWFWDLGWRLSVLAALGITLLGNISWKAVFFGGSPVTWMLTAMPLLKVFGTVPLGGMVLNFFALPIYAVLLPFLSLLGFLFFLHIPGREFLLQGGELFLSAWHGLLEEFSAAFSLSFGNSETALILGACTMAFLLCINITFSPARRFFCFLISAGGIFLFVYGVI